MTADAQRAAPHPPEGSGPEGRGASGPWGPAALAAAAFVGLCLLLVLTQRAGPREIPRLGLTWAMFLVFVVGAGAVERLPVRQAVVAALLGGSILQAIAARVRPWTTDDYLRYVWDGRVQAAGTSPYRYPPGAPELARLRDPWLFPDGVTPRLNHPDERTIYPPVAQAWFWFVEILPGDQGQGLALQVTFALVAILTGAVIAAQLWTTSGPAARVVWFMWCPAVFLEAGGNAHIDTLAALLLTLFAVALARGHTVLAGLLLGLATATKFLPALGAVGVPPRRSALVGTLAALTLAVVYLPHVLVLGSGVTGFLGGYLDEEGADHFDLLKAVLPDQLAAPVGLVILAASALWLWRDAGRRAASTPDGRPQPWHQSAAMIVLTLVILTPPYPWYALMVVPMVALGAAKIWLIILPAPHLVYAAASLGHNYFLTRVIGYGAVALVLAGYAVWARRRARAEPAGA